MSNGTRCWTKVSVLAVVWALVALGPVLADTRIEKTLDLDPGGTFRLDTDTGSVHVVGDSGAGARIVLTSRKDDLEDDYKLSFEGSGDRATVKVDRRGGGWFSGWRSNAGLHYEVHLPHNATVFIETSGGAIEIEDIEGDIDLDTSGGRIAVAQIQGNVNADTSGGGIRISGVTGDVRADTSGGSISVETVDGRVVADTSGGGISIRDVSGDIEADTSGGPIEIVGAGGKVNADTSGGGVSATFARGNRAGGSLSSSGGPVTVTVDPSVGLDIDASTSGGSVRTDLPITVQGSVSKSALRGRLNAGGAMLKLRSSGGGIRIESN